MVEKKDGAEMTCKSCGTELICHMSNYKGDFKNKLQWQNEDATAHYKFNGKDYSCNIPKQEETEPNEIELKPIDKSQTTLSENTPHNLTDHEMISRIYDMQSQMFSDWCDKKLKESQAK